jgi:hypothetical protein
VHGPPRRIPRPNVGFEWVGQCMSIRFRWTDGMGFRCPTIYVDQNRLPQLFVSARWRCYSSEYRVAQILLICIGLMH